MGNELDAALVLLAIVSYSWVSPVKILAFIPANVSSVKTSNLDVIPGAVFSRPGITFDPYFRYNDGTNAISAIARLACQ